MGMFDYNPYAGKPASLNWDDINPSGPVLNPDGTLKPQFQSSWSSIMPQIQSQLDGVNVDKSGINQIRSLATSAPGTASPWLNYQKDALANQVAGLRDQNAATTSSQSAQGMSDLARMGGLSSGARERVAKQGMMNQNAGNQNLTRAQVEGETNLGIQDENMKREMLMQLPGLENQALQPDFQKSNTMINQLSKEQGLGADTNRYNIQNALTELGSKRGFDLGQYQEQMKAWAADKTANSMQPSGKGGGLFGGK